MKTIDYSLYLVLDRQLIGTKPLKPFILECVQGGVTAMQLREKNCSTLEFVNLAKEIIALLKPYNIPLIINDRIDVALAARAQGTHIGQTDIPYQTAREILGPDHIIGLTIEDLSQAENANLLTVDYLGVSSIYPTSTKKDIKNVLGIDGLKAIKKISKHPLVAIGGIDLNNASKVMQAGADGIALVSAVCTADDPQNICKQLRQQIDRGRHAATTQRRVPPYQ